jgi:hypothetical protein
MELNMKNQISFVRERLESKGVITDLDAFNGYAIRRLSAIIYKLRGKKYNHMPIKTQMVKGKNRFGKATRYAIYRLVKK